MQNGCHMQSSKKLQIFKNMQFDSTHNYFKQSDRHYKETQSTLCKKP